MDVQANIQKISQTTQIYRPKQGGTMQKTIVSILLICLLCSFNAFAQKKVIYWNGDTLVGNTTLTNSVKARGFKQVLLRSDYDYTQPPSSSYPNLSSAISYFDSNGLEVILELRGIHSLKYRDPFTGSQYGTSVTTLNNLIQQHSSTIIGFYDDFELYPFNKNTYKENGTLSQNNYGSNRIYYSVNQTTQIASRDSFEGFANLNLPSGLTVDDICFNHSTQQDSQETTNSNFFLGWYERPNHGAYHRVIQTFKPVNNRLSRIDVKIKRWDTSSPHTGSWPQNNEIKYYIVNVTNGLPQLNSRVSKVRVLIREEFGYGGSSPDDFSNILYKALYFDPEYMGSLDLSKEYALVLEYGQANYTDEFVDKWSSTKGAHYRVAVCQNTGSNASDPYPNGRLYKGYVQGWVVEYPNTDLTMKLYYTSQSYNNKFNELHEKWIDYQCVNTAKVIEDMKKIADTNNVALYIYSGYQNKTYAAQTLQERYSLDWNSVKAHIDYSICGYEYNTSLFSSQQSVLGTVPLIGGVANDQGNFKETYNGCNGGVMYYHGGTDSGYSLFSSSKNVLSSPELIKEEDLVFNSYPNPFNPSTKIEYSLKETSKVKIIVYNILGQQVKVLENEEKEAGEYHTTFDAKDLSSGIYYCRIVTDNYAKTIKLVLTK